MNNKTLENDPDNALPWELYGRDSDEPEINFVQEDIQSRREKRDSEYKDFRGLPVFEKGKGAGRETVDDISESDKIRGVSFGVFF